MHPTVAEAGVHGVKERWQQTHLSVVVWKILKAGG